MNHPQTDGVVDMPDLTYVAKGKAIFINGHITPPVYSFLSTLPGHKKFTDYGAMFAATRSHLEMFRKVFGDVEIQDKDGTLADIIRPIPPIITHERITKPKVTPFAHQARALNIGLSRDKFAFFYEMGTGKSAIMLNLCAELFMRREIDRAIIITTKRVVPQIVEEQYLIHFPDNVPCKIAPFPSTKANRLFKYPEHSLLIAVAGYGALQSKKQTEELILFAKNKKTAILLDESQSVKGYSTLRFENLTKIRPHVCRKYLFSGEPAPLGPVDLFSQFKFLDENILGHASLTSFRNAYCIMGGYEGREIVAYRNLDELTKSIQPHSEYLKIANVIDMPEQVYNTVKIPPSAEQRALYNRMEEDFVVAVEQATKELDSVIMTKLAKNAASKFMTLQQISNGFFYSDAEEDETRGQLVVINDDKAEYVAQELIERGSKTVVFARFHADLDALTRAFHKEGIKAVEFSGRKDDAHNEKARLSFINDPTVEVFFATQASGGTGLNLQVAHRTIYYSNSFSYGDRIQSESRTWRAGQNKTCIYYDLVTFNIDKLILQNLQMKQDLSKQLSSMTALKELANKLRGK
jgi:superfamily II DNA or RNA helicase